MQSEGNVDNSVYGTIPDNQLKLTEKGVLQAIVSISHTLCPLNVLILSESW